VSTLPPVHTVVVRVWLPDRPGALGQVASRIGAVKGDVLDIEVLEVGGGRAIDEIVVALPDAQIVDLMVQEVHAIDGVSVEHVRPIMGEHIDGGLLALTVAAELAECDGEDLYGALVDAVQRLTEATWVLLARGTDTVRAIGPAPSADWVHSLLAGSRHLGDPHATAGDLFWIDLPTSAMWIAAGRPDRPIHERERLRLDLFARIADALTR
jgi:ACT domain